MSVLELSDLIAPYYYTFYFLIYNLFLNASLTANLNTMWILYNLLKTLYLSS